MVAYWARAWQEAGEVEAVRAAVDVATRVTLGQMVVGGWREAKAVRAVDRAAVQSGKCGM